MKRIETAQIVSSQATNDSKPTAQKFNQNLSKKRTHEEFLAQSSENGKAKCSNSLLAIYRDNFCDCGEGICKTQVQNIFKALLKQDLNANEETITSMSNLLTGSPHSNKQINILIYLLKKIQVEKFGNKKMDEILNLFVVIYLKCSQAVQLTFLDDIDKIVCMIKEAQQEVIIQKKFTYNITLFNLHQFKQCMNKHAEGSKEKECDYLSLHSIKKRCKRYDQKHESTSA